MKNKIIIRDKNYGTRVSLDDGGLFVALGFSESYVCQIESEGTEYRCIRTATKEDMKLPYVYLLVERETEVQK